MSSFNIMRLMLQQMQQQKSTNFDFNKQEKSEAYSYWDQENVVVLRIIPSGWENKYHCILEWGEYENCDVKLYTAEEIKSKFNIDIIKYLRKEKLNKIKNEHT